MRECCHSCSGTACNDGDEGNDTEANSTEHNDTDDDETGDDAANDEEEYDDVNDGPRSDELDDSNSIDDNPEDMS